MKNFLLVILLLLFGWMNSFGVNVTATDGITGPISYSTLKAAFDAINLGTHQGNIIIEINASTTETASAILNANGSGGASYASVKIYPSVSGMTITGNLNGNPLIGLNGADNVTIDGRVEAAGSDVDLTISNTSMGAGNTCTFRFDNDATYNTIQYCKIQGSSSNTGSGILLFGTIAVSAGNSHNTLDHNNITNAGGNRPNNVVYSRGGSAASNKYNTISNNNIYDFLRNSNSNSCGIMLGESPVSDGYNSDWTISGNSFYETTSYSPANSCEYRIISIISRIGTTYGDNFTISNNYIGGSGPGCSGTFILNPGIYSHPFWGIHLHVGTTNATSIQGNVIKNIKYYNGGGVDWWGIYVDMGAVNIGTVSPNYIGSSSDTGSIFYSCAGSGARFLATHLQGDATCFQNNIIGSITVANQNPANSTSFWGIHAQPRSLTNVISNNTIGSATVANSIKATSPSASNAQVVIGYYNQDNQPVTFSNNTIANLTNGTTNTTAATQGAIYGVWARAGRYVMNGNSIHDLTIANANNLTGPTGGSNSLSAAGIAISSADNFSQTISGNTVYNISNTYQSFSGHVAGLYYYAGSMASSVSGNLIYGLTLSPVSNAATISGIRIAQGAATFSNNIVTLGGNSTANLYGIYEAGAPGSTSNLYFNTVYLNGSPSSGSSNSACLYNAGNSSTRNFRNNILDNARSANGTHYAICFANTGGNLTCDFNDYYVSGTGGKPGYYGGDKTSLPIVTGVTGNDVNSVVTLPGFANPGGTLAPDYVPQSTQLAAATGTGITVDYNGTTRNPTIPSMGAWEYNLTPCPGPSIISQSTDAQTQCIGGTFNPVSVTAAGADLSYQWYSKPDQVTSGGTAVGINSNIYTPLATAAGTLYYYCVVTNTCGTATASISGAFVVNPLPAPTIYSAGGTTFCQANSITLNTSGNALQFGSNSRVEINDNALLRFTSAQSYTVMAWVYIQTNTNTWRGIVTKSRDAGTQYGIWLDDMNHWVYGAGLNINITSPSAATTGWHHIAIVQTGGGNRELFVDGVSNGTAVAQTSGGTGKLRFGQSYDGFEEFDGGILDEVSVFNTNLSPATINTWKNVSITNAHPDYANLVGYWKLDEGTGATTDDASGNGFTGTLVNSPVWVATSAPVNQFSSYLWSPGSAITSTLTVNTSGTYSVYVTDAKGCSNTAPGITITVNPLPVPTISGNTSACSNSTGNVYTTEASMTGYSWSVAGGTITSGGTASDNSATITWTTSGAQSISVNYTNGNGCTASTGTLSNVTVDPVSVGGSITGGTTVCSGTNSTTLTLSGYTGAIVKWQRSTDNWVTPVDIENTANTLIATNLNTSTKYRAMVGSGGCSSSFSSVETVPVEQSAVSGTLTKTPDALNVCEGTIVSALLTAGSGGNGTDILEYRTKTGIAWTSWSTYISGNTILTSGLSGVEVHTYRVAGYCDDGATVTAAWVVDPTTAGGVVTGGDRVCYGSNSTLLTLSGYVGSVQRWEWSADGTNWNPIANTVDTYTATNLVNDTWFRAVVKSGSCLVENSAATQIIMFTDYHISGYARYNNNPQTPLNGLKITLKQGGTAIRPAYITGTTGFYEFTGLINGTYTLEVASANPGGWLTWNGVNNTDYLLAAKHVAGTSLLPDNPPVVKVAASVKAPHPAISGNDVIAIQYAAKYGWGYFDLPKWVFSGMTITTGIADFQLSCSDVTRDIRGLCAGDINGSYLPTFGIKQAMPGLEVVNRGLLAITPEITFPVRAESDMEIGAITLMLDFDASLTEISGVEMPGSEEQPWFQVKDNMLYIGWVSLNPVKATANEPLLLIHARPISTEIRNPNSEIRIRFTLNESPLSELADADGNVIDGAKLTIADAGHAASVTRHENMVSVYPNPASDVLNIEYQMESDGMFSTQLTNLQGIVMVRTDKAKSRAGLNTSAMNLSDIPNGAYLLKVVCGENQETVKVFVRR